MVSALNRTGLDLCGAVVLTEAASGAYAVTPVLAAMAGAGRVIALTKDTPYGSIAQICEETLRLGKLAGVSSRIEITTERSAEVFGAADIVTNSGHVRPLDAAHLCWLKTGAVIPLMYEAWEYREGDIDLAVCREKGIRVAGTDERDPAIDVFSFLGQMAVKQLNDAGVAIYGSSVLLLCDNPYRPYLVAGLERGGAMVLLPKSLPAPKSGRTDRDAALFALLDPDLPSELDAIVVALTPERYPRLDRDAIDVIASRWQGAVLTQFWGDVDREHAKQLNVPVWPSGAPRVGHMGILPSAIGPEPIVRLQSGGLKAGEILWRQATGKPVSSADECWIQPLAPAVEEQCVSLI
jgi:hypothetical protein